MHVAAPPFVTRPPPPYHSGLLVKFVVGAGPCARPLRVSSHRVHCVHSVYIVHSVHSAGGKVYKCNQWSLVRLLTRGV